MNREIRKEKGALTTYQKQLAADQAAISQAKRIINNIKSIKIVILIIFSKLKQILRLKKAEY